MYVFPSLGCVWGWVWVEINVKVTELYNEGLAESFVLHDLAI